MAGLRFPRFPFLSRWFRKKRPVRKDPPPSREVLQENLLAEIKRGKELLARFFFTRSVESGTVREEKGWKLSRTAPGLFRLDAPDLSVLIQTAPFLLKKGGKIQGVIQLSEGSLCRMIHRGATPVDLIVSSENLDPAFMEEFQLKGKSLEEKDVLPSTESIREFSPFDLHSVLAKSGSHIIAHILLNASRDAAVKILGSLSRRAMESVLLDLKGLIDTSGSRELFPQSRIFPLQETDGALLRFREILRDHRVQQERKRKRGGSQETVVSQ